MDINIKDFILQAGLNEAFYPGKRVVKPCPQPGEYKSHCVVYDWREDGIIRIEVKAGLTGRDLPAKELAKYPISFQTATFIEINVLTGAITTRTADSEDGEDEGTTGKQGSGSGGRGFKRATDGREQTSAMMSFINAAEGRVADAGKITNMVVMGMQIAAEAYKNVLDSFFTQVQHAKIATTDLLAKAGNFITRYTPPAFLKPKGNEDAVYKYDRTKNEVMFAGTMPG